MREYRRPTARSAMLLGAGVTVVALLPVFLTGSMAVQLTTELGFSSAGLGLAAAAYRSGGAATSVFMGRLADRLGALRTIRLAALVATVGALGIALTVDRLATLVLWLAVCGSALTLAQPGANRLLANVVDPKKLGTAFGIKQSAPPFASLLAGLAVPLIAITIGWRWAFALAALLSLAVMITTNPPPQAPVSPRNEEQRNDALPPLEHHSVILLLAVGFGLGTFTSAAATTFYVASAADAGSSSAFAGTVLAVASLTAMGVRIAAGVVSDRLVTGHLQLCAVLVIVGSVGYALLATAQPGLMSLGLLLALTGSWGWNGVFWFAMVRSYPDTPGRITGVVAPGGLIGSTLGPLVTGLVIEATSYRIAWVSVALVNAVAAVTLDLGGRRLSRLRG